VAAAEEGRVMVHDVLKLIVTYLVLIGGAAALTFTISYGVFFQWTKNQAGRALMFFVLSLDALFLLSILSHLLGPDYPVKDELQFVVYLGIAVTAINLVVQLWRNRHRGDRTESMHEIEKTLDPTRRKNR
jgi:hypothetical protein